MNIVLENYPKITLRRGAKTKMLCPEGCGLQLAEFQNERNEVYLSCKHLRTPQLLNVHKGHLSLEHIIAGDRLALSLFPAVDFDGFRQRGRDITDVIEDISVQEQREALAEAA
jgi:hypothetical protein